MAVGVAAMAALTPALAFALPPAPYQTDADTGVAASGPSTLDRYGGGRTHPAARPPAAPQAAPAAAGFAAAPGPAPRYLSWSGKAAQQPAPHVQAQAAWATVPRRDDAAPQRGRVANPPAPYVAAQPAGAWRPYRQAAVAPAQASYAPQAAQAAQAAGGGEQAIPMPGPPVGGWRPYRPAQAAQPAPASIYDNVPPQAAAQTPVPAPQPQQMAAAQPYKGGPRFYSLHRDFGMTPDAIPIPPQFFGPTADLSTPPADPPLKRVTTSTGATRTQAVVTDDQGGQ